MRSEAIQRSLIWVAVIALCVTTAGKVQGIESKLPDDLAVQSDEESPRQEFSRVKLVENVDLRDFGVWTGLRLGDLTGDGRLDFALGQNRGQNITCVTAMNAEGDVLWRVGTPNPEHYHTSFDLPIQIHDLDHDGQCEVVYAADGKLRVLNGKTGKLEKEAPLPAENANDCIIFADLKGRGYAGNVVVKTRYDKAWALNEDFEVMWSFEGNTGHYPWPHDFDGDGCEELVCGYSLLEEDGTPKWRLDLPGHSDGTVTANVDGNAENGTEVGYATCGGNELVLVSEDGEVRWSQDVRHAQHLITGDFRTDIPGLELAGLDRGNNRSASGEDYILLLRHDGTPLWWQKRADKGKNRWISVITTVRDWDGREGDLILGYRRGGTTPPTLYDGHGRVVASFPFRNPEQQHFAQHADIDGDGGAEIIVWDEKTIFIYTNAAYDSGSPAESPRRPNKLLYNYTHYIGMP